MFATTGPGHSSRRRIPTVLAALFAIGLLGAACGTSTAEETTGVAALPADSEESAAAGGSDNDGDSDSDSDNDGKGDGTGAPINPEDVSDEDAEAAQLKFDRCMTDNGVDQDELFGDLDTSGDGTAAVMIDGTEDGFDEQFEAYEAALEECEPILEAVFGDFTLSPEQEAEMADMEAEFNQCMADAGFEVGSPGDGGAGQGFELDADVEIDDLQDAADKCGEAFGDLGSVEFSGGGDE